MSPVVEHVRALVQLASVLGAESNLLQPHVSRVLQLTLRAQDLTLEQSQEASGLLRDANLAESVKQRLRTAFEERLRLPTAGKSPRQNWCSLPLYLPAPLVRSLASEDGMYVKLDLLMQWLLSCGLRTPTEPTLGVVTVLVNLRQKPALLHPQTAFDLFLKCKARARCYLDKAAPWNADVVQELPADPRLLPCPNCFYTVAPKEIIMPPIFADFLLLLNSLPLRSNHALLVGKKAVKASKSFLSAPAAAPASLPLELQLALPPPAVRTVSNPAPEEACLAVAVQPSQQAADCHAALSADLAEAPAGDATGHTAAAEPKATAAAPEVAPESSAAAPELAAKQAPTPAAKRSLLECVEDLKMARKQLKSKDSGAKPAEVAEESTAPVLRCRQKTRPATCKPKAAPAAQQTKKKNKQDGSAVKQPQTDTSSKEAGRKKRAAEVSQPAGSKPAAAEVLPVERILAVYAATKSYLVSVSGGKKRLLVCVEAKMNEKHKEWIGQLHEQGNKKVGGEHAQVKQSLLDGRARLLAKACKA